MQRIVGFRRVRRSKAHACGIMVGMVGADRPLARWRPALALAALLMRASALAQSCVGDCPPPDGRVAVNELVLGVTIALGSSSISACPSYDVNGDGTVSVAELVSAVNDAQQGCPGAPTPTPPQGPGAATPTPTWTLAPGPVITFFGVTSADNSLQAPSGTDPSGIPIFERPFGIGFQLVLEASGRFRSEDNMGHLATTFTGVGPPDLQIQSTRDLGNGSPAVCDVTPPNFGGVPGIDPPQLENPDAIADALNDFGCRFVNGEGGRSGRSCAESCVRFADGDYHCVDGDTDVQFCAPIDMALRFPSGDTLITARTRDGSNQLGPAAQIIIRVP